MRSSESMTCNTLALLIPIKAGFLLRGNMKNHWYATGFHSTQTYDGNDNHHTLEKQGGPFQCSRQKQAQKQKTTTFPIS